MYSKEQASLIKQSFWKAFGQYMALQLSAEGLKINWINYKTGIRHLSFKMQADNRIACIMIELSPPDSGIKELMFDQFLALKPMLDEHLGEAWRWERDTADDYGKHTARISTCLEHVSIFQQEDWPALISFFKPRMIALDAFWSEAQYGFDLFR